MNEELKTSPAKTDDGIIDNADHLIEIKAGEQITPIITEIIPVNQGVYNESTNQNNGKVPFLSPEELEKKYAWERTAKQRRIKYHELLDRKAKQKAKQLKADKKAGIIKTKVHTKLSIGEVKLIEAFITELIITGESEKEIIVLTSDQFDISKHLAKKHLALAMKNMQSINQDDMKYQRTLAIRRFNDLYNKALGEGDIRGAAVIQKELNLLLGINQPTQQNINMTSKPIEEMSREELKQLLNNEEE